MTWRPNARARATPLRSLAYGNNAGGGTIHYGAVSWRFHEDDFRTRSHTIERYGIGAIPEGTSLADWPLGYAELEPFYDRAEYDLGVSGKAGNLQGSKVEGGNVFEAPRRRDYPLPPLAADQSSLISTPRRRTLAIIRSRRLTRFCRKPTTAGRVVPIADFARLLAVTTARNRARWSPSCRKPTPAAISSLSPARCAIA